MITRLKKRCFCEKIFASFSSLSSSRIIQRDYDTNDTESELIGCAGNTQGSVYMLLSEYRYLISTCITDTLSFFATNTKFIRLCVIDYAGLSNDPDDVYNTLKYVKPLQFYFHIDFPF